MDFFWTPKNSPGTYFPSKKANAMAFSSSCSAKKRQRLQSGSAGKFWRFSVSKGQDWKVNPKPSLSLPPFLVSKMGHLVGYYEQLLLNCGASERFKTTEWIDRSQLRVHLTCWKVYISGIFGWLFWGHIQVLYTKQTWRRVERKRIYPHN